MAPIHHKVTQSICKKEMRLREEETAAELVACYGDPTTTLSTEVPPSEVEITESLHRQKHDLQHLEIDSTKRIACAAMSN